MQVLGVIDVFSINKISGWVFEKGSEDSVEVVLKHNDNIIAKTVANMYRKDLKEKEIHPTGHCGFVFDNFQVNENISLFDLKVEALSPSTVITPTPVVRSDLNKSLIDKYTNNKARTENYNRICYLHVGMHKTGSSSIQQSLYQHVFTSNTKYLGIGFVNHSIPFYSLLTEYPEQYHINRREDRKFYDCLKFNKRNLELIEQYISKSEENIIISGEDISVLPTEKLETLRSFLESYFDSVHVLIYIRPPHSFMSSDFQELIKNGLSGDGFSLLKSGSLYPNYRKIIEKFDNTFGQGNVQVRLFDRDYLAKGDVVQDFIEAIGLDENIKSSSTNTSLSLEEASVLYLFNNYYINNRAVDKEINSKLLKLRELIKPLAATKLILSQSLTQTLIDKNLEQVKWTASRANINSADLIESTNNNERAVTSAKHLEDIGWQQLRHLISNLEGGHYTDSKDKLLNKLISDYL